ncbi:MAG: nucleotidyltransferase domain-containing protein [Clostridiales bacterium]|nr:nucleotidyltransferase domain-containing protein [Clostridiales bacterium]
MKSSVLTLEEIIETVKPIARRYKIQKIYLFGSYARGEATRDSDLDFLIFGGRNLKLTSVLHLERLEKCF